MNCSCMESANSANANQIWFFRYTTVGAIANVAGPVTLDAYSMLITRYI